ncbi:hypothetical protein GYH30_044712 [Glycine max]|nr:hypothetical protein GYH30_044712 [Glycine max]
MSLRPDARIEIHLNFYKVVVVARVVDFPFMFLSPRRVLSRPQSQSIEDQHGMHVEDQALLCDGLSLMESPFPASPP